MGIYGRSYVPPIIIRGRPGAGANQIGLAVETDTSQALGKKRGISLASETDSALTVARATSAPFVAAVGSGGRYLVDQYGSPIFVRGCSPQDMAGAYTPTNVATLWADQAARGINAAQVHAMVTHNTGSVDYTGDPPWTNMSTFSGASGSGTQFASPNINVNTWAPTGMDIDQWLDAAVAGGATFAAFTSKHLDGFSLWPTAFHVGATGILMNYLLPRAKPRGTRPTATRISSACSSRNASRTACDRACISRSRTRRGKHRLASMRQPGLRHISP